MTASVFAFDRGYTKGIYMPVIIFPLVLVNVFVGEFILGVFDKAFTGSYGSVLENFIQNTIILVTLEIMHTRYVAPQHPTYIGPFPKRAQSTMPAQAIPDPAYAVAQPAMQPDVTGAGAVAHAADRASVVQTPDAAAHHAEAQSQNAGKIVIARQELNVAELVWIKSEDHYLSIQMQDRNLMLRGKLRTAVGKLSNEFGLQINRSVWVAYDAIRTVDCQQGGNVEVLLDDDTVFNVSKTRLLMFKQNYERFKALAAEAGN